MAATETIPSWAVWVPVVSAGVGGVIAIAGNIAINYMNKKHEEKKQLREVIIKTAMESRNEHIELAKQRGGPVLPIESYIVHMAILSEIMFEADDLTEDQLLNKLRKSNKLARAHKRFDEEQRAQQ